ncbi:DEKNAAC102944 [Brettanomyces naardenensis]|uniref:phosphatidylserine decarboxylase n=1 Tax=Brettanomyces naardenensis TaxID=13370 RepID=A0A448YM28_BRENA|nr:DEKNAAC102944 [Brettanomyces naardenensis]
MSDAVTGPNVSEISLKVSVSPIDDSKSSSSSSSSSSPLSLSLPPRSLVSTVTDLPHINSSASFLLQLSDIRAVLYSKLFNDTFTITDDPSQISALKLLQLSLAGISTFATTKYLYTFQIYSDDSSIIKKYVASLEFLESHDEESDEGNFSDDEDDDFMDVGLRRHEHSYIQLSDEERNSLSPYVRFSDGEENEVTKESSDVFDDLEEDDDDLDGYDDSAFASSTEALQPRGLMGTGTTSFESLPERLSVEKGRFRNFRAVRRRRKYLIYEPAEAERISGFLILNIVSAAGLPPFKDSIRIRYDMDPFVVVSLGTKIYRTSSKRHSLNPIWSDQYVNLEISPMEKNFDIKFNVLDKDRFSFNDQVCSGKLPVRHFLSPSPDNNWHTVELPMKLDPKSPKKYVAYCPALTIRYKFQSYNNIVGDLKKKLSSPEIDFQKEQIFLSCPLCGKRDRRNFSLVKHVSICRNGLSPGKFLKKSYTTSNSATRRWYSNALIKIAYGKLQLGGNNANIMVQDRDSGLIIEERMSVHIRLGIRMLYKSIKSDNSSKRIKRMLARLSRKQGIKFDSQNSRRKIASFVKFYGLDLSQCVKSDISQYGSFNEFFSRKFNPGTRKVDAPDRSEVVVSCADSRMTVFHTVSLSRQIWVKGRDFKIAKLMGELPAGKFNNGAIAIARLAPQDYHRFHSPVCGEVIKISHIEGEYYTVNPMAIRSKLDVFGENVRTIIHIKTEQFGMVVLCAVGAMMVGSIRMTCSVGDDLKKGDELGYFKFGGSTVIMLFEEGKISFDEDLAYNSEQRSIETLVKVGMSIGHTPDSQQYVRHPGKKFDKLKIIRTVTGTNDIGKMNAEDVLYESEEEGSGSEYSDGSILSDDNFYPSWEVNQLRLDDEYKYEIGLERQK